MAYCVPFHATNSADEALLHLCQHMLQRVPAHRDAQPSGRASEPGGTLHTDLRIHAVRATRHVKTWQRTRPRGTEFPPPETS